jgi:hypothetical protein
MKLNVNFRDVNPNDGGFKPLPAGVYEMRVVDVEHQTSQKGSEMFRFAFEVLEGPEVGKKTGYQYLVVQAAPDGDQQDTSERLLGALYSMGFDQEDLAEMEEISPADIDGEKCTVRLGIKKQEGYNDQNDIKQWIFE